MSKTSQLGVVGVVCGALLAAATTVSAQIPRPFGSFVATRSADPVDGTTSSGAFSAAADPSHPETAIAWRCMADGLNVIYLFGAAMDPASDTTIGIRAGVDTDNLSPPAQWPLLRGRRAAHLPLEQVDAFTQRAIAGLKLAVHVTDPRDGRTVADEFSLQGLSSALDYILPCGATSAGSIAITPRLR